MEKLKKILINPQANIKQALKQMDSAAERILLVADNKNLLLGTITDGDIRRWILKGESLNERVSKIMKRDPVFLYVGYSKKEAKDLMVSKVIECIPVVNKDRCIISAVWWLDLFENSFKKHQEINAPVVIMAGGEGSRLAPFTNVLPKPLIPLREKPILELIIDRFFEFGCKNFYLSLNYKANLIKAYFNDFKHDYNLNYIHEDKPLGTVGGLQLLKKIIKETFFLSNCDILIDADYSDIFKFHKENKNKLTVVVSMKHFLIPYGICNIKNGGILSEIREKPEYDFLVNTGLYLLEQDILNDIPKNRCYHATDLINNYIKKDEKIGVYPVSERSWIDIGQLQELKNTLQRFEKG